MILPNDIQKCTGITKSGVKCTIKQNCKRYLSYKLDNAVYVWVDNAPDSIEIKPLDCILKITAHIDEV